MGKWLSTDQIWVMPNETKPTEMQMTEQNRIMLDCLRPRITTTALLFGGGQVGCSNNVTGTPTQHQDIMNIRKLKVSNKNIIIGTWNIICMWKNERNSECTEAL